MQRRPSPKITGAICTVPWRNSENALARSALAVNTSVSAARLGLPVAHSCEPPVSSELSQPRPLMPVFAHGHGPAVPSPEHTSVPMHGFPPPTTLRTTEPLSNTAPFERLVAVIVIVSLVPTVAFEGTPTRTRSTAPPAGASTRVRFSGHAIQSGARVSPTAIASASRALEPFVTTKSRSSVWPGLTLIGPPGGSTSTRNVGVTVRVVVPAVPRFSTSSPSRIASARSGKVVGTRRLAGGAAAPAAPTVG